MLLWMSFEAVSILPIFSDGLIVIRSEWRSRGHPESSVLREYGSPATWTQDPGTQKPTR